MNGTTALDTIKSFKEIMTPEDYQEFVKGEDSEKLRAFPEVAEFLKGEKGEEKEGEKEEPGEKKEGETKDEEEKEEKEGDKDDKKEKPEFMKAFADDLEAKFETKLKGVTDILKSLAPSIGEMVEIKKSVDSISEVVNKIAGMPQGTRAVKTNPTFFEKALSGQPSEDESGKTVLSISGNKEKVLEAMEKGMDATKDGQLIKGYEDSIIKYNGGGGHISQEVAIDLFENHNIRLLK